MNSNKYPPYMKDVGFFKPMPVQGAYDVIAFTSIPDFEGSDNYRDAVVGAIEIDPELLFSVKDIKKVLPFEKLGTRDFTFEYEALREATNDLWGIDVGFHNESVVVWFYVMVKDSHHAEPEKVKAAYQKVINDPGMQRFVQQCTTFADSEGENTVARNLVSQKYFDKTNSAPTWVLNRAREKQGD